MTLAIALQTSGEYNRLLSNARWAEAQGLASFAVPDHYLMALGETAGEVPAYDGLIQLAALARDTTTIPLCVMVSPITFRHPAVLAKTALTLDELSGGRFSLGVGTGWMDREHEVFGLPFPPRSERFAMLEEALGYVRAVLDDTHPGFDGELYQLEATATAPRPSGTIPLVVGGTGAHKTPYLAGTYADEYNCYPAPVAEFRMRINRAREAAVAAGRDPGALLISSAGAVLAAPSETEYQELLEQSASDGGITTEELEAHMAQRNTPRGTYEQVIAQLRDLAAAGMQRFYIQRGPDFDRDEAAGLIAALAT